MSKLLIICAFLGLAGNFCLYDIGRGQAGYDSLYYRLYVPATSPVASLSAVEEVRNLPLGQRAWIHSGFGCAYLVSHEYNATWASHEMFVYDVRSRWGLPCHEARWWGNGISQGIVIADGGPETVGGQWQVDDVADAGGRRLVWTRTR